MADTVKAACIRKWLWQRRGEGKNCAGAKASWNRRSRSKRWKLKKSFDFLTNNFFRIYFAAVLYFSLGDRLILSLMSLKIMDCKLENLQIDLIEFIFENPLFSSSSNSKSIDWVYIWEWLESFDFLIKNFFRIYFAAVLHIFHWTFRMGNQSILGLMSLKIIDCKLEIRLILQIDLIEFIFEND